MPKLGAKTSILLAIRQEIETGQDSDINSLRIRLNEVSVIPK